MSENYMAGTSLADRQMHYYNAHKCPYCNGYTDLIDSGEVYQESHGLIYICRPCQAWVGVHNNGSDQAMGTLAKKPLRVLRHEAHKWFDPLCDAVQKKHELKRKTAQGRGYKWLAKLLQISIVESHIGYFNEEQCRIVIAECKKFFLTPEQMEQKRGMIKFRQDIVEFLAGELDFPVQTWDLNGIIQMQLVHPDGRHFNYKPKDNTGAWSGQKWNTIKDIEKFIQDNFK